MRLVTRSGDAVTARAHKLRSGNGIPVFTNQEGETHMQISGYRPLALPVLLTLAALGAAAHAAGFDEKLKSPQMTSAVQVRSQAATLAATLENVRAADATRLVTDPALARQRFELQWKVQRAIDEKQPLNELAAMGVVARGDGSYAVDVDKFPVWDNLHDGIVHMLHSDQLEPILRDLQNRGFRPEDAQQVRDYVVAHDARVAQKAAWAPISLGFARAVRKYDNLKVAVPNSLVWSYSYQRARAETESNQAWLNALLKTLDAQRGRVLISFFQEYTRDMTWSPENIENGMAYILEQARKPNFEATVEAEAKGVAP
jgi:hypothetical protein